ncbi:MAG: AbrB/MazE/SpoVT family DNA-binding domain-containing protein [Promethearchaeia archaeon]
MKIKIKKVDYKGRIILPDKWREKKLKETNEVILFEEGDILRILPKRKYDLTQFFDSLEFEEGLIDKLDKFDFEKDFR